MSDTIFPAPSFSDRRDIEPGTWAIGWGAHWLFEDEVTGEHLATLILLNSEDSWASCDLSELAVADPGIGPGRLMSWIVAMVVVAEQTDDTERLIEIVNEVRTAPASKIIASLHRY